MVAFQAVRLLFFGVNPASRLVKQPSNPSTFLVVLMCKAKFKNIRINAVYVGDEAAPFMPNNYNNHRVSVYNADTHKRTSFKFWASMMSPELRTRYDALNALYCFIGDAVSGLDSFNDFCGNFGYDPDSRTAYKTWQTCQRSAAKALRVLGVSRSELYDFLNELSAIAA